MSAARLSAVVKRTLAQLRAGEPIEPEQLDVLDQNLDTLLSTGAAADLATLIDSSDCDFFSKRERNFFLRLLAKLAEKAAVLKDTELVSALDGAIYRYVHFATLAAQSLDHHAGKNPAFLLLVTLGEELKISPDVILDQAEALIQKESQRSDAWATKMIDCLGTIAERNDAEPLYEKIAKLSKLALGKVPKKEQVHSLNEHEMLMLFLSTNP